MGQQFIFWNQQPRPEVNSPTPEAIFRALMEESVVDNLQTLPTSEILRRLSSLDTEFASALSGITDQAPQPVFWVRDDELLVIEFSWSDFHLAVEFRPFGSIDHGAINHIIDTLAEFGCPLYDPQLNERFNP